MILDIDETFVDIINIKHELDLFFSKCDYENSKQKLMHIKQLCINTQINEMISFSRTITNWMNEICNTLIKVKLDDNIFTNINNSKIERVNRTIKILKNQANSFKNFHRFRNRVLYVVNKDSTYYINPTIPKIIKKSRV